MTDPGSHLEAEIREQPEAVRRLLDTERGHVADLADRWRSRGDVHNVVLVARGSSDNAARYGQYVLGARDQLQVGLATPSLFSRYRHPPRLTGALVGAISQSGHSPDVIAVVEEAKRQGRPTVALTNDVDSPLAAAADAVIGLHAGTERSVAATKTYTCSLAAIALVSVCLADGDGAEELDRLPDQLHAAITTAIEQVTVPDWLVDATTLTVIGRGFNYATAFEAALKLKELTGIAAEPYSSADFLHGPVAAANWRTPAVLLAPSGVVATDVLAIAGRLRERGAKLVVVADGPVALEGADLPLALPPDVPEWLSPVTAVVPAQVLAWRIAQRRGLDVDQPLGLQKVTRTR
jgi:glutamine---fructose-6-phosphate transaminase (isomerizing)